LFKALGDPARVRLVNLRPPARSWSVCNLIEPLGLTQPTVSHHMSKLREAGLVDREQRGKGPFLAAARRGRSWRPSPI
jgi:ArsR family transcriptional regulator